MKDIYFDNSSTSFPKAPNVGRAMGEFIENGAFNINRGSYEGAYEAGSAVLDTREMLKDLFNAPDSKNVVFTPSVTYSLNYFIKGFLKPNDHVLVTSVEHTIQQAASSAWAASSIKRVVKLRLVNTRFADPTSVQATTRASSNNSVSIFTSSSVARKRRRERRLRAVSFSPWLFLRRLDCISRIALRIPHSSA